MPPDGPKEYAPSANALRTLRDVVYIHKLPSYGNTIFYGLGFLTLTSLILLILSGATLAFMGQAWWLGSPLGVYVRSVHLWSVQAFIALLILHMLVGFVTSAFKPPRRMVWVFGALIFSLALFQTEFGYGLRGDFSSQFRAVSGADFWNGAYLGYVINPLSHLQEFAIHVAVIPLAILALFVMHFILVRVYGISKPYRADIRVKMVPADHGRMYLRGGVLAGTILLLALFFHSPYVPALTIADVARQDPSLVGDTLQQEYDHTSDTATYLDSIDPYTFDTREVFVLGPYRTLVGGSATTSAAMTDALMPTIPTGAYQSALAAEDPAPDTYTLRFLNDMNALEDKAATLHFDTAQMGMARDENGGLTLPPGSWWFLPLGLLNRAFDLPDNPQGDRIAAETFGLVLLVLIAFPYIPYLNRLPEALHLAPFIWRRGKTDGE
jgi:hypothetical protein